MLCGYQEAVDIVVTASQYIDAGIDRNVTRRSEKNLQEATESLKSG